MSLIRRSDSTDRQIVEALQRRRSNGLPISAPIVNSSSATTLSAFYAGVRIVTNNIATIPVHEYTTVRDGSGRSWPERTPNQPTILTDPYPRIIPMHWKQLMQSSAMLRGNAFGFYASRDRLGWPQTIIPVHPSLVTIRPEGRRGSFRLRYKIAGEDVNSEDILHMVAFPGDEYDGLVGISIVDHFARTLGLTISSEDLALRYFAEGTHPQSILETDEQVDDPSEIQADWLAGGMNTAIPRVLTGGLKWKPISITPEESQFLLTRGFGVAEAGRITGVPNHKLNVEGATSNWGSGVEQHNIGFVTDSLTPWLVMWEQHLTRLRPRRNYVKHNVNGLLRGDTKSRAAWYTAMRTIGAMNNDEIRDLEELPPLPDDTGQDFAAPFNNTAKPDSKDDQPNANEED